MDSHQIMEIAHDVFGRSFTTRILGDWVSMKCPLAPYTHAKGSDNTPSAGISIKPGAEMSIYNCLSADTQVRTIEGYRSIGSLAGKEPLIQVPTGEWVRAPIRAYGVQKLYAVNLTRNGRTMTVHATAGHRWFAQSQGGGRHLERTTAELKPGHRMKSVAIVQRDDWEIDEFGFRHGAVYGDGSSHWQHNHVRLNLYGPKVEMFDRLRKVTDNCGRESAEHFWVSGQYGHLKQFPALQHSRSYLLGFLSGWLSTDGCVDARGNVSLSSADRISLGRMEDLALALGIETFGISGQFRKGYTEHGSFIHTLRFVGSSLNAALFARTDHRERYSARSTAYERLQWQVASVEETDWVDTVYCAEVPEHAAFVLQGGLVTGNCFTCHTKVPMSEMYRMYADFTGDNLDDLIEEIAEGEFLGPRTILSKAELKALKENEIAMPIEEGIHMDLYESAAGHPYLKKRGISDATAKKMELLYDPKDTEGDPRILFPVRGPDGLLYGFSGRATQETARLKVRDYFGLAKAQCVLGSHLADTAKRIVIVEGLIDVALVHEMGECGCGVMHSTMTDYQREIIVEINKPTYLMYDNDKAGDDGNAIAERQLVGTVPLFGTTYPKIKIEDDSELGWHWLKDPGEMLEPELKEMLRKAYLL